MDDILDDLVRNSRRCDRAAKVFDTEPLDSFRRRLSDAAASVGESSSQSWLGYHARVYIDGFYKPGYGQFFDKGCGLYESYGNRTQGNWRIYEYDDVEQEIFRRAGGADLSPIKAARDQAEEVFEHVQSEILPLLDAVLDSREDPVLRKLRDKIEDTKSHHSRSDLAKFMQPKGQFFTNDQVAINQGMQAPPHVCFDCWLLEQASFGLQLKELAKQIRHAQSYLEAKFKMKGKTVAKTEGKIFIGHGGSKDWQDLKLFIMEKLKLPCCDFNSDSTAGKSNKEVLLERLDESYFAFLVMTAEDEKIGGTKHARENVVHEVGLFQGRLSFERAIVLLEDSCSEFSNIEGLTQIRFTKGRITDKAQDIREVLEREGILK